MALNWHYHRSGCTTCKKMSAMLDELGVEAEEVVSANKTKYSGDEAVDLAKDHKTVVVAKGKKVQTFEPGSDDFDAEAFEKAITGPTGNLRAPALRFGDTLLIGFHEDYADQITALTK